MKFAYADPPYPGQAHLYRNHPDFAGEVDHAELIGRLCRDYPDGWALSTSGISIQPVLALCPPDVRVAVWHCTNQPHPGAARGWWWSWEAVIVRGGRPGPVCNVLTCAQEGKFIGGKPPAFTRWMLELLGAEGDDQIDDLFPGSGAVTRAIASWHRQPVIPVLREWRRSTYKLDRDMRLSGAPMLWEQDV